MFNFHLFFIDARSKLICSFSFCFHSPNQKYSVAFDKPGLNSGNPHHLPSPAVTKPVHIFSQVLPFIPPSLSPPTSRFRSKLRSTSVDPLRCHLGQWRRCFGALFAQFLFLYSGISLSLPHIPPSIPHLLFPEEASWERQINRRGGHRV